MKYLKLINCSLTIILTAITIPCLASSLREIEFLSSIFNDRRGASIPAKVFNGVLERRISKINEFKERNNLTSKELVFCEFLCHSLESMQVLFNSSSKTQLIVVRSNLIYSYKDIVDSFYSVFDDERTSSVDYAPVVRRATRPIEASRNKFICGCDPNKKEKSRETKTSYSKSKILILIDDYISDFNLYVDYRLDQKPDLSVFIETLETLKSKIFNVTGSNNDLKEYNPAKLSSETKQSADVTQSSIDLEVHNLKSANLEAMKISWMQFEFTVQMFLYRTDTLQKSKN